MTKLKIKNKANGLWSMAYGLWSKPKPNTIDYRLSTIDYCIFCLSFILCFNICHYSFAQQTDDLEFTLDVSSNTVPLPKIFKPDIDLSGRGFNNDISWPQNLAANEVLTRWQKDIGLSNMYRMQYSLWEIAQLAKDKDSQDKLLANYDEVMKNITDAGGIVILDIFGTPAGSGQILDKKSAPRDIKSFKELIKNYIRDLSCNKRYNIWYEVWDAPDSDDFFLGRRQEYLNLYRAVAESVQELEAETKIHIPVGGPSVSWWFQDVDGNTIATPEKSLIYELIKFCSHYRLPLDFISWHAFSSDPLAEKESSIYKKTAAQLIRDWLSYFNLDRSIPLIVDEWNYDRDANVLSARAERSFVCASYIPSRLKNMYEAGIDYQVYFCLEDFQNNKEGIVRNVGIFSFNSLSQKYDGAAKSTYTVFRMLSSLGNDMFLPKFEDTFVGVIAAKQQDGLALLIYNYIDPDISMNYISRNIANLKPSERKALLNIIKSDKLEKIMQGALQVSGLRVTNSVKNILKKAHELSDSAKKFAANDRNIKIEVKNLNPEKNKSTDATAPADPNELKVKYLYQRYIVDASCNSNCEFSPVEEKDISAFESYQEKLTLKPYSVQMIVLKKKPKEPEVKEPPKEPESINNPEQPAAPSAEKNTDANAGAKQ